MPSGTVPVSRLWDFEPPPPPQQQLPPDDMPWEDVWDKCALGAVERAWHDATVVAEAQPSGSYYECTFGGQTPDVDLVADAHIVFDAAGESPAPVTWRVNIPFYSGSALPFRLPLPTKLLFECVRVQSPAPFKVHYKYAAITADEMRALRDLQWYSSFLLERGPDVPRVKICGGMLLPCST